jgi:hypothetical protein
MSFFHDLLHQVGAALKLPAPLEPNKKESCMLQVEPDLNLFLELSQNQEQVVIGCQLGEVPPGAYGNRLLLEALKANGAAPDHSGILAYSKQSGQLVLFDKIPLTEAKADEVVSSVNKMLPRARQWHSAIKSGQIPPPIQTMAPTGSSGMFGLR